MQHTPRTTTPARRIQAALHIACLLVGLSFCPSGAQANGGGGGSTAPAPLTFTVNVGPFSRATPIGGGVLQASLVLHAKDPEVQHEIDLYKPMVIHHIHLAINGFTVEELRAPDGKDNLADAIIERVNKVLNFDDKKGVEDVFFTSFILQAN